MGSGHERLWQLDPTTALTLLEALVARRILKRQPDGRYARIDQDLVA
jgi:DNA-binding IclR family transcriptional regulator